MGQTLEKKYLELQNGGDARGIGLEGTRFFFAGFECLDSSSLK